MGLFDSFETRVKKTHIINLAYVATERKRVLTFEENQFIYDVGRRTGLSQSHVDNILRARDSFRNATSTSLIVKFLQIQQLSYISHMYTGTMVDSKIKIVENIAESYGFHKEIVRDMFDIFLNLDNWKNHPEIDMLKYLKE
ncbi:MAG: hypothetical protein IPL08_05790 [Saprospiraceae bacterium]|nr:hypothetical protein [Saprospiraceae bacterium]MBP6234510.1 hypothetical protein [Saprospiraceae bacterium]